MNVVTYKHAYGPVAKLVILNAPEIVQAYLEVLATLTLVLILIHYYTHNCAIQYTRTLHETNQQPSNHRKHTQIKRRGYIYSTFRNNEHYSNK